MWSSFKDYLYIDRKLSDKPASVSADKTRFNIVAQHFSNKDLNRDNFNTFIAIKKAKKYAPSYINNMIKIAKHLDRWLKIGELEDYTYFKESRHINADILSPHEIEQLASIYIPYKNNAGYLNKRNEALILLLGTTGCRIGEALNLTFDDLYSTPPHAILKDTKNGDDRTIILWQRVYDLIVTLPRLNEYIFPSARKGKLDHQQVNLDLKVRANTIGLTKPIWCHLLRHSYITTMIGEVDWFDLAPLIGHKDPKTTQRYVSSNLTRIIEIAQAHPLLRKNLSLNEKINKIKQFVSEVFNDKRYVLKFDEKSNTVTISLVICKTASTTDAF